MAAAEAQVKELAEAQEEEAWAEEARENAWAEEAEEEAWGKEAWAEEAAEAWTEEAAEAQAWVEAQAQAWAEEAAEAQAEGKALVQGKTQVQGEALVQGEVKPEKPKPPNVHGLPGFKLLGVAEFLFSPKTCTNVLEPIIRDLQDEHNEALAALRLWKARYVRMRGYCAFWCAVSAQTSSSLVKLLLKALGVAAAPPS